MSLLSRMNSSGRDGVRPGTGAKAQGNGGAEGLASRPRLRDSFRLLRAKVQDQVLSEIDPQLRPDQLDHVRELVTKVFEEVLQKEDLILSRLEREVLLDAVLAEVLGYGPIQPLLEDETVTEIMVNGYNRVYVERAGKIHKSDVVFEDDDHLLRVIDRIVSPLGRRIDESSPMVDARLPDGSRVNAVIPPLTLDGPTLTVRKFSRDPYTVEDLIQMETLTEELADFLRACVGSRLNVIVSGGTSTGKTTLLNVLSSFIVDDERIVTIENAAELQLRQEHVVRMESRPANIEGRGEVSIRDLVVNSLRMRPDRIIVGEVRAGEALDMLQAMNTGHDGGMTTLHCNSPRDALHRLETMVLMAGMELPLKAIRQQIASAIDLIVHLDRMADGRRRVAQVSEVQGMEGDVNVLQDVFRFVQVGIENGMIRGSITPTGIRPKFTERIELAGFKLPADLFSVDGRRSRP